MRRLTGAIGILALLAGCASSPPKSTPEPTSRSRPPEMAMPPPAPGQLAPGDYVEVEELPEAIGKVAPRPGPEGVTGTVLLQALVGGDGRVHDVKVVRSIPGLDSLAVEAVRQWVFKPALNKGKPVAVWVMVPLKFPPP